MLKNIQATLCLLVALAAMLLARPTIADVTKYPHWLPDNTKGYFAIPDVDELSDSWSKTQYGHLFDDPVMKPFTDDFRDQILRRLDQTGIRMGVSLRDLDEIANGAVCVGVVEPKTGTQKHALVLIVDTTDRDKNVGELLDKIDKNMEERKATSETREIGGNEFRVFEVPVKRGSRKRFKTVIGRHGNYLVAVDHEQIATDLLGRMSTPVEQLDGALANVEAFIATKTRCQALPGNAEPAIHWFVEPFGFLRSLRSLSQDKKKRRGNDLLGALEKQGFDVLQGAGGFIDLANAQYQLLHRSYVYAPALPGVQPPAKYKLAARILEHVQTTDDLRAQDWVADDVASYRTLTWDIQSSFEHVGGLVDEMAGEDGFFEDLLDSLKNDPTGPMIDVRNQLIAHFGDRGTYVSDCPLPVTPTSQRFLLAIDVKNAEGMTAGIHAAMDKDPDAKATDYGDYSIWEILQDDEEEIPDVVIDGDEFDDFDDFDDEEEEEGAGLLNNASFAVVGNHLLVSSHIDFIKQVIDGTPPNRQLGGQADYKSVNAELVKLGAGTDTCRFFSRNDQEVRTTYELIRQGKMPESETILGRLLNQLFAPEEKGVMREQQIDGKDLPEFEAIAKYFGPSGLFARAEADERGTIIVGCMLAHQGPELANAEPALETADVGSENSDE